MVAINGKSYHFSSYPVNHALWAYTKAGPSGSNFYYQAMIRISYVYRMLPHNVKPKTEMRYLGPFVSPCISGYY